MIGPSPHTADTTNRPGEVAEAEGPPLAGAGGELRLLLEVIRASGQVELFDLIGQTDGSNSQR